MKNSLLLGIAFLLFAGCELSTSDDKLVYIRAIESLLTTNEKIEPGIYNLNSKFAKLSIDGKVIVSQIAPKKTGYVFVLWRGRNSNFKGIGYFPSYKTVEEVASGENYYGQKTVEVSPTIIRGTSRMVDASVEATDTPEVYLLSYDLD